MGISILWTTDKNMAYLKLADINVSHFVVYFGLVLFVYITLFLARVRTKWILPFPYISILPSVILCYKTGVDLLTQINSGLEYGYFVYGIIFGLPILVGYNLVIAYVFIQRVAQIYKENTSI